MYLQLLLLCQLTRSRYFPKGAAHTVHGLSDEAEYLLVFDEGDFDAFGTTFNVDDWISHTPKDILAKNFGTPISRWCVK